MKRIMTRKATKQSAKAVRATVGRRAGRTTTRNSVTAVVMSPPKVATLDQKEKMEKPPQPQQQQQPKGDQEALKLLESGAKPLTGFQRKVLQALCRVPAGQVTTYKKLAQSINCSSNQAIGQALRRNPYAPTVPCHRVVATTAFVTCSSGSSSEESNGTNLASNNNKKIMSPIGGFGGCLSGEKIDKKIQLLKNEGVKFIDAKRGIIDPSCMYTFHEED